MCSLKLSDLSNHTNAIQRTKVLLKNTLASSFAAILNQFLSLITLPILINTVGTTDYGMFALATSAVGYFSVASFAARRSVVKYISEFAEDDKEATNHFFNNALLVNVVIGLIIFGTLILMAIFCQDIFKISIAHIRRAKTLLLMYACAAILFQPLTIYGSVLYGMQHFGTISLIDAIWAISRTLVILAIYFFNGTIFWLAWEEILFQIFKYSVLFLVVRKRFSFIRLELRLINMKYLKQIAFYGGWSVVYTMSLIMVYQGTMILVGVLFSVAMIAYFQIAYKLYNLIDTVAQYTSSAVLPSTSSALAAKDSNFLSKLISHGSNINLSILLTLTVNMLVFSQPIIEFWMGAQYTIPTVDISRILLASWFFTAPTILLIQVYWGQANISKLSILAILCAVFQMILIPFLAKPLGLKGVALTILLYFASVAIFGLRVLCNNIEIDWFSFIRKILLPNYIATGCYAFFLITLLHILGNPQSLLQLFAYFFPSFVLGVIFCLITTSRNEILRLLTKVWNNSGPFLKYLR